jgi:predicted amidophosphoribosyltransferase
MGFGCQKLVRGWYWFESQFLSVLAPKTCLGCGKLDTWICWECLRGLGEPKYKPVEPDLYYLYPFKKGLVEDLLLQLKYCGLFEIAAELGQYLRADYPLERVRSDLGISSLEGGVIVPVPTSKDRLKTRGYNQAEQLARAVGAWLDLPVLGLLGKKPGASLVGKGKTERNKIAQFFTWKGKGWVGEKPSFVLVVDDVITTGSTIKACLVLLRTNLPEVEVLGLGVAHEL